jgi:hypothetical protein
MKRSFFLLGLAGAALTIASVRIATLRRARLRGGALAGRCVNQRRKLRWSGYTAADFS